MFDRSMTVVVEFSVIPIGAGVSVSRLVALAVRELQNLGVKYMVTPMGTVFEAEDVGTAFEVIRRAHEAVFSGGAKRVVTEVKIDDRRDVERRMENKVESVKRCLERKD